MNTDSAVSPTNEVDARRNLIELFDEEFEAAQSARARKMEELAEQTPATAPLDPSEESSDSDDLPQGAPTRNPVDEWVEGEGWVEHKPAVTKQVAGKRPRESITFIGKRGVFYEEIKGVISFVLIFCLEIEDEPDLEKYFAEFGLSDFRIIALCRTYANYLAQKTKSKRNRE